jgi:hypothetical protein
LIEILRQGEGSFTAPNKTVYLFSELTDVQGSQQVQPVPDLRFRDPSIEFSEIQNLNVAWSRPEVNVLEYSRSYTLLDGQTIGEGLLRVALKENQIAITFGPGRAMIAGWLSGALTGRAGFPWNLLTNIYHDPSDGTLLIETSDYGWFRAGNQGQIPSPILRDGSLITDFTVLVDLAGRLSDVELSQMEQVR